MAEANDQAFDREGREIVAGVRKKPLSNGKYQGWFINLHGKRKFFTGTHNRRETLRMAERLEDDHLQYAVGYRPLPTIVQASEHESFEAVKREYLAWGMAQGGRDGRPWSKGHTRTRVRQLDFWQKELRLDLMQDLHNCLIKVERAVRALLTKGLAGKTVATYIESLNAFCEWCIKREFLDKNPLANLQKIHAEPTSTRRAMTSEEIIAVLGACNHHEHLLLETALLSGLRARELRHLSKHHLDIEDCGLHLESAWTKNRKKGFQPLPKYLVQELQDFVKKDGANQIYTKWFRQHGRPEHLPDVPLLYVPSHTARSLDNILRRAGIPKVTKEGKVDFHACRVAYITLLVESGANLKEVQTLARHSDPRITMGIYSKVRNANLSRTIESIAKLHRPQDDSSKSS